MLKGMFQLILIFSLLVVAGCASNRSIDMGSQKEDVYDLIEPGEHITILTTNHETFSITIDYIDMKTIAGAGKVFSFKEILEIERDNTELVKKANITSFFKWGMQATFIFFSPLIIFF